MFIDGYYCVPSVYEKPDINIEIGEGEKCFFRLLTAPSPIDEEPTDKLAQWISLPCDREQLDEFSKSFGTDRIEDMVYYDFQSALPMITDEQFGDMYRINELNLLAEKLLELRHMAVFPYILVYLERNIYQEICRLILIYLYLKI